MRIAWLYCTHVFMSLSYVHTSQPKPKIVRFATGSTEYGKPTLELHVALSASYVEVNTRCATSDVNTP